MASTVAIATGTRADLCFRRLLLNGCRDPHRGILLNNHKEFQLGPRSPGTADILSANLREQANFKIRVIVDKGSDSMLNHCP
jgi:hypothetical protein